MPGTGDACCRDDPSCAAQVSDTDVQAQDGEEVLQQAGQQDAPAWATVAEETSDQVDAGLTLSHGPAEQSGESLAQVL